MTARLTIVVVASVALVASTAAQTSGDAKPPTTQSASTAKPGSLAITVVSEAGAPLGDVTVRAHGPADRGGTSGGDGLVTLVSLPPGTYRCRLTRDGFITLDKEVIIRAGARTTTEAVLSAAPPPPPPAPPPPAPKPTAPAPVGVTGEPRIDSLLVLIEQMLKDTQPILERDLGCSGAIASRLIVARENVALHRHADADEVLYVVAGEATLTLAEKDQVIVAGWYALAPRGVSHSLARRGRNPLVVLSMQSGPPCTRASKD